MHTKEQRSFNMSRIKGKHAKGDTGEPKLNQFFFQITVKQRLISKQTFLLSFTTSEWVYSCRLPDRNSKILL